MNAANIKAYLERHRTDISRTMIHIIVIIMLFLLPEFVSSYARSPRRAEHLPIFIIYGKAIMSIIIFYIEYYIIIGRTLTTHVRPWRFLAYSALLLISALAIGYIIWYFVVYQPNNASEWFTRRADRFKFIVLSSLIRDMVLYILVMALAVALRQYDHWLKLARRQRDMADEQRESELRNLKNQLNPHFLFNTLNSIYALIDIDTTEARAAVHRLSQMLRYMLYETPAQVTLRRETDFARNYISLMELRLPQGIIDTRFDIDSMADAPIAPLIFISLIENAFKHGNTGRSDDHISINITARDGVVTCSTRNHFNPSTQVDRQGGIGLANLRRRLSLIYGDSASLTTTVDGDVYEASLSIQPKALQ